MDYRGVPIDGGGNLAILLGIGGVWLIAFIILKLRQAVTGKSGNAGTATFTIVMFAVFGFMLLAATFIVSWFMSGAALLAASVVTGTPFDKSAMSPVFLLVWLLVGLYALYRFGRDR